MMSGKDTEILIKRLQTAGIDEGDARFEVRDLLEAASSEEELESFMSRRESGEPCSYITGFRYFYKDRFHVIPGVLIPRNDTEMAVETALAYAGQCDFPVGELSLIPHMESEGKDISVIDLCCGSGCIGISVANELLRRGINISRLVLADISPEALRCASQNVSDVLIRPDIAEVVRLDVLDDKAQIGGLFDMVLTNPPYINDEDMENLPVDVSGYEPSLALRGGKDGLMFYPAIANLSKRILRDGGALIAEHGYDQRKDIETVFAASGFGDIVCVKDPGGNDRVSFGRYYAG